LNCFEDFEEVVMSLFYFFTIIYFFRQEVCFLFYGGNTQTFSYEFRRMAIFWKQIQNNNFTILLLYFNYALHSGRSVAVSLLIGCVSRKGRHFRNDCWPWVLGVGSCMSSCLVGCFEWWGYQQVCSSSA
jgi:hypothetical protein